MHNEARAEIHQHDAATWVSTGMLTVGMILVAFAWLQLENAGRISKSADDRVALTSERYQMAADRMTDQQRQIQELRDRLEMAEAKVMVFERRLVKLEAPK